MRTQPLCGHWTRDTTIISSAARLSAALGLFSEALALERGAVELDPLNAAVHFSRRPSPIQIGEAYKRGLLEGGKTSMSAAQLSSCRTRHAQQTGTEQQHRARLWDGIDGVNGT